MLIYLGFIAEVYLFLNRYVAGMGTGFSHNSPTFVYGIDVSVILYGMTITLFFEKNTNANNALFKPTSPKMK